MPTADWLLTFVLALALAGPLAPAPTRAEEAGPVASSGDAARLRALVLADDFTAAHALCRAHARGPSTEWVPWGDAACLADLGRHTPVACLPHRFARMQFAALLGLDDLVLSIADELSASGDLGVRRECALWTALAYARRRDFPRAVERMRAYEAGEDTSDAPSKVAILERFAAGMPSAATLIAMAADVWVDRGNTSPLFFREAREALVAALARRPSAEHRRRIYALLQQYAIEVDDLDAATAYAAERTRLSPAEGDDAAIRMGQALADCGLRDAARRWLERLVAPDSPAPRAGEAHALLARICREAGDTAGEIRHLQAALRARAAGGAFATAYTWAAESLGLQLGDAYRRTGDFERALAAYAAWRPAYMCGNAAAEADAHRECRIAQCLMALGRVDEAVDEHLLPHVLAHDTLEASGEIVHLLVDTSERQGRLDSLVDAVRERGTPKNDLITSDDLAAFMTLKYASIRVLVRAGNVEALVAKLASPYPDYADVGERTFWVQQDGLADVSRALADLKDPAAEALVRRYEALVASYDAALPRKDSATRAWVLYALSRSESPPAIEYLRALDARARAGEAIGVTPEELRAIAAADLSDPRYDP